MSQQPPDGVPDPRYDQPADPYARAAYRPDPTAPQPPSAAGQAWPAYPTENGPGAPGQAPWTPTGPPPQYGGYDPAPLAGYGASPYGSNVHQPYGDYPAYGPVAQPHPQAVLSLVLGIAGVTLCPLAGIAGLVLSNGARRQIDRAPQSYSGRGMVTAGFVLGIVSVIFTAFWVLVLVLGLTGGLDP